MRSLAAWLLCTAILQSELSAQQWNSEEVLLLVARSADRRSADFSGGGLVDYAARAHGYVFFLAQFGEEFEQPKMVKSDQLELEVYWRAPDHSKQRIIGWRDRVDLPTGIRYHRDHLGIIQNNFGNRIRLGEGDEVRDVVHPLSPDGFEIYDYALVDSLAITIPERTVNVYEVAVRPRDLDRPGIVGSVLLDASDAAVVRFWFNFTPSSYLDASLEDVTVVIENSLWNTYYWLPSRQEIEIRRSSSWLDIPARGIIRARWTIDGYRLNAGLPDSLFRGREIVAAPQAVRDTFLWRHSLEEGLGEAAVVALSLNLREVRADIARLVARRAINGLRRSRPGARGISELVHFNRVEGLALGAGGRVRSNDGAVTASGWVGYGFGDSRVKARLSLSRELGDIQVTIGGSRTMQGVGEYPIVSGLVNSISAQEFGRDLGDYLLLDQVALRIRTAGGGVALNTGVERPRGVASTAAPAAGEFRPNPDLSGPTQATFEGRSSLRVAGARYRGNTELAVRGGVGGGSEYLRLAARATLEWMLSRAEMRVDAWGGWGSQELPRHRSFVMGGWGTLPGEGFRRWGGRRAGLVAIELGTAIPFPEISLGAFASTGGEVYVGSFVAGGVAGGGIAGVPWVPSEGLRSVAGVAVEVLHRLLRLEVGWSLREGTTEFTLDLNRSLWRIL